VAKEFKLDNLYVSEAAIVLQKGDLNFKAKVKAA
jgi:hypothetical protein